MQMTSTAIGAVRRSACLLLAACMLALGLPLAGLAPQEQAWAETSTPAATTVSCTGFPSDYICDIGESFEITYSVATAKKIVTDAVCEISSSDPSILSVEGNTLTAVGIGKVSVKISYAGDSEYASSSTSRAVYVFGGLIESGGISARVTSFASNGEQGTCKVFEVSSDAVSDDGSVAIPESLTLDGVQYDVTSIGNLRGLTKSCSAGAASTMKSLTLPSALKEVGVAAFKSCTALENVCFSAMENLEAIGSEAFYGCSSLSCGFDLSSSKLQRIDESSFYGCALLPSVRFPNGLKSIGKAAFASCKSLQSLVIPASVEAIGKDAAWVNGMEGAFYACTGLKSLTIEEGSSLQALPFAFYGCTALETVSLGEGIEEISWRAFYGCTALKEISIPASVTSLCYKNVGSFKGCTSLEKVEFASGSKLTDAVNAFEECSLKTVDLSSCTMLSSFEGMLPATVNELTLPEIDGIDMSICHNCTPDIVNIADDSSFYSKSENGAVYTKDGSKLLWWPPSDCQEHVVLSSDCSEVGCQAFINRESVASITLQRHEGDMVIGAYAFSGCSSLSSFDFGSDTVLSIGDHAFYNCSSLVYLDVPGVTGQQAYSDYYTDRGTEEHYSSGYIIDVTTPANTVKTAGIGDWAFAGCTSLKSIRFRSAPGIGCYALFDIQTLAFYKCDSLENIVFDGRQPYWLDTDASIGKATQGSGFFSYACYLGADTKGATRYYAVDYYLTRDNADSTSEKIATVEYARGTDVSRISRGDTTLLSDSVLSGVFDSDEGAAIPDPNAIAAANGMSGNDWVWAFEDHFGEYGDLFDSCYVYLAHAGDLTGAYMLADPLSSMREPIRSTISTSFDAARWFGENKYDECYIASEGDKNHDAFIYQDVFDNSNYNYGGGYGASNYLRFKGSCYFTWGKNGAIEPMEVRLADGTLLEEGADYEVSYQAAAYENGAVVLQDAPRIIQDGPYLMTVTAKAGGRCQEGTSYSRWILVKTHSSTVTLYNQTNNTGVADTELAAIKPYAVLPVNATNLTLGYDSTYDVTVYGNDPVSAVLGCQVAGLKKARVKFSSATPEAQGFVVAVNGSDKSWTRDGMSDAEMATFAYTNLNAKKTTYGFDKDERPWGDTALLCSAHDSDSVFSLASFVYQTNSTVFFTDDTGGISEDTLSCLKDFDKVILVGDESLLPGSIADQVGKTGAEVSRIAYSAGDACGLSIALSQRLIDDGVDASVCALSDGLDRMDTVLATDYVGFVGGISLVASSTADAKRLVAFLYENRDAVSEVRIYGRSDGTFSQYDIASAIMPVGWDSTARKWDGSDSIWAVDMEKTMAERTALSVGDTLCLDGMLLTLQEDGTLAYGGTSVYGKETLVKGQQVTFSWLDVNAESGEVTRLERTFTVSSAPEGYLADASLATSSSSLEMTAGEIQKLAVSYDGDGQVGAVSSNESVATASLEGEVLAVTAVGYGEATVEVSAPATETRKAVSATVEVFVGRAEQTITAPETMEISVGDEAKLGASALGDAPLSYKSSDESVATVSEDGTVNAMSAGTASVTVTAARTDAYKQGTRKVTVIVTAADASKLTIGAVPAQTYTGKALAPKLSVSLKGRVLTEGSDYIVSYKNNVNVGTATATVTGKGSYTGEATVKFSIAKASQTVAASKGMSKTVSYKKAKSGKHKNKLAATKTVTAAQMKTKFGLSAQGALTFAKANTKGGAKIVVASNGKVTVKKGLNKGTYKVKVKVTAKATANYNASSAKYVYLTVKVK